MGRKLFLGILLSLFVILALFVCLSTMLDEQGDVEMSTATVEVARPAEAMLVFERCNFDYSIDAEVASDPTSGWQRTLQKTDAEYDLIGHSLFTEEKRRTTWEMLRRL